MIRNESVRDTTRKIIENYLANKKTATVEDIKNIVGIEHLRVYPILFQMEQEGILEVLEREELGAAKTVRLIK